MSKSINFRVRAITTLIIGFVILVVGLALYFQLNAGTTFFSVVLGLAIPFFFIGGLLLRAYHRVKKGQPPFSSFIFLLTTFLVKKSKIQNAFYDTRG